MTTVARRSRSPVADMLSWLESGTGFDTRSFGLAPYVKVEDYVDEGTYVLRADMPGIDPDKDVEVTIEGDIVTIHGERREEQKDKNHHEIHYGSFARSVPLPRGVRPDQVTARYADGVLEVRIPVGTEEKEVRRVEVARDAS
jgi:HSP20 family protein